VKVTIPALLPQFEQDFLHNEFRLFHLAPHTQFEPEFHHTHHLRFLKALIPALPPQLERYFLGNELHLAPHSQFEPEFHHAHHLRFVKA